MKQLSKINNILGSGKLVGGDRKNFQCVCPFCHGKKFFIHVDTGKSECKSGKCQRKFSNIYTLERAIAASGYLPGFGIVTSETAGSINVWKGELLPPTPAWENIRARKYLTSRRVDKDTSYAANIWSMSKSNTLVFELHNFFNDEPTLYYRYLNGNLRWIGEPGFERVKHTFGYIPEDRTKTVVVEGIFDVLSPGLWGYAVAMLGANVSSFFMAFLERRVKEVYHLPDRDAAGEESARQFEKQCKTYGIKYNNVGPFMYRNMHPDVKDPGDLVRCEQELYILKKEVRRK